MTMKNKETLEKLRTYQIGVIRSVIASRQGRQGTYSADATDRERLADTDDLADEEYYESPLTIRYEGLCHNVISLEFCEDGLTPVCLVDGGDGFPLPLENLSCDTLQGIVEWLEEYDFIPSAEAAPQTTSDLTEDFVERCLPEYPTRYDVFRLGELQNFLDGHESPEFGLDCDEAAAERDRLQLRIYAEAITAFMKRQPAALPDNVSLRDYAEVLVDIAYEAGRREFRPSDNSRDRPRRSLPGATSSPGSMRIRIGRRRSSSTRFTDSPTRNCEAFRVRMIRMRSSSSPFWTVRHSKDTDTILRRLRTAICRSWPDGWAIIIARAASSAKICVRPAAISD